ncbi:MAG: hypothetical protein K6B42_00790 [Clostridia bacterium]|nr:hypothetical protein [Clostridia bacterium]
MMKKQKHEKHGLKNKWKYLLAATCMALLIPAAFVSADSGLVSGGQSSVESGGSVSFTVNLENKEEYGTEYSVSIGVSPSPESVTVNNVNANVNAVSGSITVKSADLDGMTSFSGRIYPGEVTEETTFTVSVSVAGDVSSDSGSFSFTVTPAEDDTAEDDTAADDTKEETEEAETVNKETGGMPDTSAKNKSGSGGAGAGLAGATASGTSSTTSSVTYAGSADNYLEKLSVSDYDFTQKFNKTRDTYFVNVPDSVTELEVSATACDDSATVKITGEEDVSADISKIMISVTADNGDVRIYRIYVTHNAEE